VTRLLPVLLGLLVAPAHALAAPSSDARVLLVVASHRGHAGETRLRYAERDAQRVARVFRDLGGLSGEDLHVLVDPGPADLRSGLGRATRSVATHVAAGRKTTLLFYYSGHADRRGLHLGTADFAHEALRKAVATSGASIRIVVLDACESGGITRKGVSAVEPFALSVGGEIEGEVVITSSAADEASLESEQLAGSFFTHHLVAGLRGAADRDDGRVTLAEAYSYAYRMTLADTGATRAGPQHPSYELDLRGMGDLVLTDLRSGGAGVAGHLRFAPDAAPWMVLEFRDGPALASLPADSEASRILALPAGSYWLRRRGDDGLEEARVELRAGETRDAHAAALQRVAYAEVVRKGLDPDRTVAHAVGASNLVEAPGLNGVGVLLGGTFSYRLDLPLLSVLPTVSLASGAAYGSGVPFGHDELSAGLATLGAFDLGWGVLSLGPELRWIGMRQRFTDDPGREGATPDDRHASTIAYGVLGLVDFPVGWDLSLQLTSGVGFVRLPLDGEGVVHRPRVRLGIGLGWATD